MSADNTRSLNISGYTIQKKIGEGGMASVWLATQDSLGRPVALKVLASDFSASPEFSKRFLNEGRILASLRHANIITIYDLGIDGGVHYISMEYVEGNDLKSRIRAGIKPGTALDYIETIASGLHVAHTRNIVHRDIKPANVLFRDDDTLLVTDFGIAKQLDETSDLTVAGSTLGSPHYLSPEQAQSRPVDARSDIYSLGIMLYEMIVRQKPYRGDSELNTALKHITDPIPMLPQPLQSLQPLLEKMIAKAPSDRFANVTELIDALRAFRSEQHELLCKLDALTGGSWSSSAAASQISSADAKTLVLSANEDTQPVDPSANTVIADSSEARTQTLVTVDEQEMVTEVRNQDGAQNPSSSRAPGIEHAGREKTSVRGEDRKPHSLRRIGAVAVVALSALVGIGVWTTQTTDMPASLPGTTNNGLPVEQASASAQSSPGDVPGTAQTPELTSQATSAPEPAAQTTSAPQASAMVSATPDSAQQIADQQQREAQIADLLSQAQIAIKEFRLTKPEGNNALGLFQKVLQIDPENEQAKSGPASIAQKYAELARSQLARQQYSKADEYVHKGLELDPENQELLALKDQARQAMPSNQGKQGRKEDTPKELYDRVKRFFN